MKIFNKHIISLLLLLSISTGISASKEYWWPDQKLPAQILRVSPANLAERNLVQSISGLAARSVNAGTNDELIWTSVTGSAYNYYLSKWLARTSVQDKGNISLWNLVDRYMTKGIIKGYILYKEGDYSVNFATIYASLYDAVLIEESLEATAISRGLTLKFDARSFSTKASYTQTWFNTLKTSLNNKMIVTIAPTDYRQREMAIAHNCMVYWGVDDFYKSVLDWMEPNSPVVGWNEGDEGTAINACSEYGQFTTGATIVNLSILSAGSRQLPVARAGNVNPREIDFSEKRNYLSYVMSDGGNMMIQATGMALADEYRANPDINNLPMCWASCPVNLIQMVPDAWNLFTAQSAPTPGSLTEFSGGLYPDLYGLSRGTSSETIRRQYAGMINRKLKSVGVKVFGCLTRDIDSDEAKKMYQIFADSIDGLVGIIAIQYVPYNGGNGAIYWVTNKDGKHIPVLTAKYYLHNENSKYVDMGGPVTIANSVNAATSTSEEMLDWTIVHAWSYYKKETNGVIRDAESTEEGALRGVTPSMWSKSMMNNINIVSIEELLWRLRMKHYPQETAEVIRTYTPDSADSLFTYPDSLEIDFSNFSSSTTDMSLASHPNNWYSASKNFWTSQYCYAQDVTSLPYIGKSIRFGASTQENTGSATTSVLNLKANYDEEVVLRISVGCGNTKGGVLDLKVDDTIFARIDAKANGDSGENGTTFGTKMYTFDFVLPSDIATNRSVISLVHSRNIPGEYIYINQFKVFRRAKVPNETVQNTSEPIVCYIDTDDNLVIKNAGHNAIIQVYNVAGSLLHTLKTSSSVEKIKVKNTDKNLLLVKVTGQSGISYQKLVNI